MGDVYLIKKDYQNALTAYYKWSQTVPHEFLNDASVAFNRAESFFHLGEHARAKKEFEKIILINPDVEISDQDITVLSKTRYSVRAPVLKFERKGKTILDFGGKINWLIGRTSHLEVKSFDRLVSPYHLKDLEEIEYVSGACMVINTSAFKKVKGFDERFFLYYEDADFCLRIKKAGLGIQINPKVVLSHNIGEHRLTKNKFKIKQNLISNRLFIEKWLPYPNKIIGILYWYLLNLKIYLNNYF
jgi:GT2 family glycosyltransferase